MKRFTKAIIAATLLCIATSQSTAMAQFRFGKSGGSKGGSSSLSRGGSSSRGQSGSRFSSGSSRFQRSSSSKGISNISRIGQSRPQNSRVPQIGKPSGHSKLPTHRPQVTKPSWSKVPQVTKPGFNKLPQTSKRPQIVRPDSLNKLPLIGKPSSKLPLNRLPLTKGPVTKGPQIVKPGFSGNLPQNKLPQINKPQNGHPLLGGGIKGQIQKHVTQKFQRPANWQNLVHNIIQHNRRHWCHTRPTVCHWWVSYCTPIAHCNISDLVVCDWNRVQCAPIVQVGTPVQDVQWYLGMKGILLPGRGIGIDAVEPNSPAEQVGLQPGMVLTVCNGIPMTDETAMAEAIRISGGVLNMTLLSEDGTQVLEGTVRMIQVAAVSF